MTLIKAAAIKFNPLEDGPVADVVVPKCWSGPHVGVRVADCFRTLARLPASSHRTAFGYWPSYAYGWQDMLAQLEQAADEQARERRIANCVRITPDLAEVSAMERAICWPMQYLGDEPLLARAVNAVAFAHAFDRGMVWVERKHGGVACLWRRDHWDGCEIIARGLVRDKVGVF